MLREIAQGDGDLTLRLEVSSEDEIGDLGLWFNTFVERIQGLVGGFAETANSLVTSSDSLSRTR